MLTDFLTPLSETLFQTDYAPEQWGSRLLMHRTEGLPSLDGIQLALIGIGDTHQTADHIRRALYELFYWHGNLRIADLGTILPGATPQDTLFAVQRTVARLLQANIVPILIGGKEDLCLGQMGGHAIAEKTTSVVVIDEKIDLTTTFEQRPWLAAMLQDHDNLLYLTHIGHQRYLTDPQALETGRQHHLESYGLGEIRTYLPEVEALVREAQMVGFQLNAIRQTEGPGAPHGSPNGLWAEEACQIARYAGLSDHVRSIGFYNLSLPLDVQQQTTRLAAQLIWYFAEGYADRKHDFPYLDERSYIPYIVNFKNGDYELIFLKSKKSDRWWMKVPVDGGKKQHYKLVPCTYRDYEWACKDELPDRWLRAYWRLNG